MYKKAMFQKEYHSLKISFFDNWLLSMTGGIVLKPVVGTPTRMQLSTLYGAPWKRKPAPGDQSVWDVFV